MTWNIISNLGKTKKRITKPSDIFKNTWNIARKQMENKWNLAELGGTWRNMMGIWTCIIHWPKVMELNGTWWQIREIRKKIKYLFKFSGAWRQIMGTKMCTSTQVGLDRNYTDLRNSSVHDKMYLWNQTELKGSMKWRWSIRFCTYMINMLRTWQTTKWNLTKFVGAWRYFIWIKILMLNLHELDRKPTVF